MQELQSGSIKLLTADQLRSQTISAEEKFERDKNNVLQNLMSSMVQAANLNGDTQYSASLNPAFNKELLSNIKDELVNLDYQIQETISSDVNLKNESNPKGEFTTITISWKAKEASEVVEDAVSSETE